MHFVQYADYSGYFEGWIQTSVNAWIVDSHACLNIEAQ